MNSSLRLVKPESKDLLAIRINKAAMLYEKGFGRRYSLWGAFNFFKSVGLAAPALLYLLPLTVMKYFKKQSFQEGRDLLYQSLNITIKGILLGFAKLAASPVVDPFKLIVEAYEKKQHPEGRTALLIIDMQKDFTKSGTLCIEGQEYHFEEGNLGVDDGYAIIPLVNQLMRSMKGHCVIAASLDWHPKGHKSFASSTPGAKPFDTIRLIDSEQILWPDHCIQESAGAEFLLGLHTNDFDYVVKKGMDLFIDSYSAFFDNGGKNQTNLHEHLQGKDVKNLIVVGIATDYCVKFTALDGKKLGYDVTVVEDACRGVNRDDSVQKALEEMRRNGIKITTSTEFLTLISSKTTYLG